MRERNGVHCVTWTYSGGIHEDERTNRDDTAHVQAPQKGQMCLLRGYALRRRRCRELLANLHDDCPERPTGRRSAVPSAVYCRTGLQAAFAWNQSCDMIDHMI